MTSLGPPGLRARMTASYVLVTAMAVLLVEGIAIGVVIPGLLAQADLSARIKTTAAELAGTVGIKVAVAAQDKQAASSPSLILVGDPRAEVKPGAVEVRDNGIVIPQVSGDLTDASLTPVGVIVSPQGRILASSFPVRYPIDADADGLLAKPWRDALAGTMIQAGVSIVWATAPIYLDLPAIKTGYTGKGDFLGTVYVQAPQQQGIILPAKSLAALAPLLQTGALLLLVTMPVGVVFGLLTTRGVIRRLRALASGTVAFAGGNFALRLPVSGQDEVGQLERHFNAMAERLAVSIEEQRALTDRNARLAERSRISRELHDSISQDLFSLSALSAGLRQALPGDSPLQPQLDTLSATVGTMIQEMRALLLELRPTALDRKGLPAALDELCDAYEARVGLRVSRELAPVALAPPAEDALFRVAQEALANAARHSDAEEVAVRLRQAGGQAELTVEDQGRGFDPGRAAAGHGLGLKLMAERVHELAGSFEVASQVGGGARITVSLPVRT